jgi:guanosine-3',5'-bis(diphosphate) 3'-pyrophosphohydrolase
MVRMAKCCNPVPGDDIIGYITRGRGVSIHRCDCPSMGHSPEDLERMIEVSWDGSSGESFHVGIDIQAYDRAGILMEVMAVLSELKITITNINAKVQEDTKNVSINLVVDIRDISQLDFVMTKLRRIREVYTVQRSKGGA